MLRACAIVALAMGGTLSSLRALVVEPANRGSGHSEKARLQGNYDAFQKTFKPHSVNDIALKRIDNKKSADERSNDAQSKTG